MTLEKADRTVVWLRDAPGRGRLRRHGTPRCRRVLLAIGPDGREAWRSLLLAAGHLVVTVEDAEAALDALADEAFDACLLDLDQPEALESAKLYRFLALDGRPVPIVGLTERSDGTEARHGGVLSGCLPRGGDAAALAALGALLPDLFRIGPDQGEPARVVSIVAWRQARMPPG
jgi:CheY-like chemotaxis protein